MVYPSAMRARMQPVVTPLKRCWRRSDTSGLHRLLERQLPVLDLQDDDRLHGVAVLVEAHGPRHALPTGRLGQRLAQRLAVRGAGALDRVREELGRVVAEGRHGVGLLAVLLLELLDEVGDRGGRVPGEVMIAIEAPLDRLASDLE